jgi:hypothetical protein
LHSWPVVRRFSHVAIAIGLAGACDGVLREKPSNVDVDAGPLGEIQPPPCDAPATAASDGHHHAGEDCAMCHHQGGDGPPFTFAGTVYDASGGARALAGGSFHLIDANGTDVIVTSQTNGNFWSTELVTFPLVAFASQCPDVIPMRAPLAEGDGSCNRAGCHTSGFRLHLP